MKKQNGLIAFYKKRLKDSKGAMDKILVTLLLVVAGVGAVYGIITYTTTTSDTIKSASDTQIQKVLTEADSATTDTAE